MLLAPPPIGLSAVGGYLTHHPNSTAELREPDVVEKLHERSEGLQEKDSATYLQAVSIIDDLTLHGDERTKRLMEIEKEARDKRAATVAGIIAAFFELIRGALQIDRDNLVHGRDCLRSIFALVFSLSR
jgi:hypothetical protein